ncbi:c-type cytochrome [Polaromonas naphthalenivorans]|uniref:Cytochrome c, class I n=1 Tax=Polaromonas naphthalenivorans (strain CJ2) TaxID=365044 RepID=A1VJR4_POLNA|nr:c-type cytochrome [Polaromonas naphthalenivorans]ABM35892.1 cytochrome c, class I [Polaromonas naphthalenivorans CJ2]
MKILFYSLLVSACLLPSVMAATPAGKARAADAAPARSLPVKGDPVLGREKAESERCMECHGVDGHGAGHSNGPEGKFAKLAGQHPDYILKQIRDFRSGARKHDQMQIMARSVSDEDMRDIAAYFGSQPAMNAQDGERHALGKSLYENGDPARGVVACSSCHGVKGKGLAASPLAPVVGGQEWRYLDQQLRDWRSGERRNSDGGVMSQATKALTDADIESLANYLSGI